MGPALVLPASGVGWTWWLGPTPPLWALLAPIREVPWAPVWGFQKHWLKQLLKLLCLSCPLQQHGRGYTAGLSERASLNPCAIQVEEICEWTLGYTWEEQYRPWERESCLPHLLEHFAGGSRSYLGKIDGAVLQNFSG